MDKATLRKRARAIRQNLDMARESRAICEHVASWREFRAAQTVLLFYPLADEVNLLPLMEQAPEKQYYLPRVTGPGEMTFHLLAPHVLDTCEPNAYGILEPRATAPVLGDFEPVDLILTPALMLDAQGVRLGFGGGFYDRFLARLPEQATRVCPIPEALTCATLPGDAWDVPMHWAVTGSGVYQLGAQSSLPVSDRQ